MKAPVVVLAAALAVTLAACTSGPAPEPTAVPKPDPQTRVVDDTTRDALADLSFDNASECLPPDDPPFPTTATDNTLSDARDTTFVPCEGRLVFDQSTPFLADLQPGNILVSEPGPAAPYGYLQRVTNVTTEGDQVIVTGVQASLDDALIEGEFDVDTTLGPDDVSSLKLAPGVTRRVDAQGRAGPQANFNVNVNTVLYDYDGNANTTNDQIRLKGNLSLATENGVSLSLRWKKVLGVPIYPKGIKFRAAYGFAQSANLRVEVDLDVAINKEVELLNYHFNPIVFFIGPVPIVLVPTLRVTSDLKGNLKAQITFGASENVTARAGFEYNGDFTNISEFSKNFSRYLDVKTIAGTAEAGLNLKGDILLYGLVGPYARVRGAVLFDAAIPRDPAWTLSAGLQGYAGIHADLLVKTLNYDAKVIDVGFGVFAQSDPLPPTITITSPANGSQVQKNAPPPGGLCVNVQDIQNGQLPADITANGVPIGRTSGGTLANCLNLPAAALAQLGTVTFVARVTNSRGLSASATSTVTVVNTAPTLSLQYAGTPREGEDFSVAAVITDPNEPNPSALCANTNWSVDAPDTVATATGCNQTIHFGTAGPRQLRVTTRDSDGASASQTVALDVQPPPNNPYPRVTSAAVRERVFVNVGLDFFCGSPSVNQGVTIDLRLTGCQLTSIPGQPTPTRYFADVSVDNPTGETLTYDWRLYVTQTTESVLYQARGSSSASFDLSAYGNAFVSTDPCRVTVTVNAPDPSRSKSLTVWSGTCTYYAGRVN